MNKDELIKLREKLLNVKIYAPLFLDFDDGPHIKEEISSLKREEVVDDTDIIINQCENLIENALIFFHEKGFDLTSLGISTSFGICCDNIYANNLNQSYFIKESAHKNYREAKWKYENETGIFNKNIREDNVNIQKRAYENELSEFEDGLSEIKDKIIPNIIPVSIRLNPFAFTTDTKEFEPDQEWDNFGITNVKINGYVNYNKFFTSLKKLGYDVNLNGRIYNGDFEFDEYLNIFKDCLKKPKDELYSSFDISVDLTKKLDNKQGQIL